jgi:hypothetical protein
MQVSRRILTHDSSNTERRVTLSFLDDSDGGKCRQILSRTRCAAREMWPELLCHEAYSLLKPMPDWRHRTVHCAAFAHNVFAKRWA